MIDSTHSHLDHSITHWLSILSANWQVQDAIALSHTDRLAMECCVQTGLVEIQIPAIAWESDLSKRLHVTFFISGAYQPVDLVVRLCDHVSHWEKEKVTIQPDSRLSVCLTTDGLEAQEDLNSPGIVRDIALLAVKANRQPARVRCHIDDFGSTETSSPVPRQADCVSTSVPSIESPPTVIAPAVSENSKQKPSKTERIQTWLTQYLHKHHDDYDNLMYLVLASDSEAQEKFVKLFGPKALAESFTRFDGNENDSRQRNSNKTMISKSDAYKYRIKPLLHGKRPLDDDQIRQQKIEDDLKRAGV